MLDNARIYEMFWGIGAPSCPSATTPIYVRAMQLDLEWKCDRACFNIADCMR